MKAQYKATEIYMKMFSEQTFDVLTETSKDATRRAKNCSLMLVDEILQRTILNLGNFSHYDEEVDYWQQVKQELEKL